MNPTTQRHKLSHLLVRTIFFLFTFSAHFCLAPYKLKIWHSVVFACTPKPLAWNVSCCCFFFDVCLAPFAVSCFRVEVCTVNTPNHPTPPHSNRTIRITIIQKIPFSTSAAPYLVDFSASDRPNIILQKLAPNSAISSIHRNSSKFGLTIL